MLTCPVCGGLTPRGAGRHCLHCDAPLRRSRLQLLLGPAGAILLAACYGPPGRYYAATPRTPEGATRVDLDGDGSYGPWQCPQDAQYTPSCKESLEHKPPPADLDCDDHDPTRFPGAADPDGDGIDQNCDGVDGVAQPSQGAK